MNEYLDNPDDVDSATVPCRGCGGTGINIEGGDCEECDGYGYFEI